MNRKEKERREAERTLESIRKGRNDVENQGREHFAIAPGMKIQDMVCEECGKMFTFASNDGSKPPLPLCPWCLLSRELHENKSSSGGLAS